MLDIEVPMAPAILPLDDWCQRWDSIDIEKTAARGDEFTFSVPVHGGEFWEAGIGD
jgi:hypothetical protein